MVSLSYPAMLRQEAAGKGYVVRFADLPEALTGGGTLLEALEEAGDCLGEALACRIARGEAVPRPSKGAKNSHRVPVPLHLAPKVALYMALRERGIGVARLARQLGWPERSVRQLLDPKVECKPERFQAALAALGKQILLTVDSAA